MVQKMKVKYFSTLCAKPAYRHLTHHSSVETE